MTRPPDIVLTGNPGVGSPTVGEALVSRSGFSARYDLDREKGIFSRPAHDLYQQSYVNRVLVFPTAKGGIATSWMLAEMASRNLAPKALIFSSTNPVMVQGAVLAGLPLMAGLRPDPTEAIETGDHVELDPPAGRIRVWRNSAEGSRPQSDRKEQ